MSEENLPPDPGGSSNFSTDTDPGAVKIGRFWLTLTDVDEIPDGYDFPDTWPVDTTRITLRWTASGDLDGITCLVEQREGLSGTWTLKATQAITSDNQLKVQNLGAGVNYCYRVSLLRNGCAIGGSQELVYRVPPIDELDRNYDQGIYHLVANRTSKSSEPFIWYEVCKPFARDAAISAAYSWQIPLLSGVRQNDNNSEDYTASACLIGCPPRITLRGGMRVEDEAGGELETTKIYQLARYAADPEKLNVGIRADIGAKSGAVFEIDPSGFDYGTYKLEWTESRAGAFAVLMHAVNTGGNWQQLSSPHTFTDEELNYLDDTNNSSPCYNFNGFRVEATDQALPGDSVTVTVTAMAPDGMVLGTPDKCKFYYDKSRTLDVPLDDASGAKYRKIALNGRPLMDEKPQATAENDQQTEETFVDAMTLSLRHNTTDAYVPVPGSELSLSVRRNVQSEVWNLRSGLRPHERPDLPFGPGWNSNLTANVHFVLQVAGPDSSVSDPDYAYVTDENGASYRFVMWKEGEETLFCPLPTARHEQNTYLSTLAYEGTDLVFTKKFGSRLVFESTTIDLGVSKDRLTGSPDSEHHVYFRLRQITDRQGLNILCQYETGAATSLIPKTIQVAGGPDSCLYIRQENGRVTEIWDANWNLTSYGYSTDTSYNVPVLTSVTTADENSTAYAYDFVTEQDLRPLPASPPNLPVQYIHCDVKQITDANGNQYNFTYMLDHEGSNSAGKSLGRYNFHYDSENPGLSGYYPGCGHGRLIKTVSLPDGTRTEFENYSLIQLVDGDQNSAVLSADSERRTRVKDAAGNWRTYQWGDGQVYELNNLQLYYDSDQLNIPRILYYTGLTTTHEGMGTESYQFSVNAGLNVIKATDFSGNVTQYEYGDTWSDDRATRYRGLIGGGINGVYEDPTQETRTLMQD